MSRPGVTCPDTWPACCAGCLCPLVTEFGSHTTADCRVFMAMPATERAHVIAIAYPPRRRAHPSTPSLF